jgi:hypothetical protein
MKQIKKQHLPEKTCPVCGRPFSWRKKWERNWEQVRYCSKKCSVLKKGTV